VEDCPAVAEFETELATLITATTPGTMLNRTICQAYRQGVARLAAHPKVSAVAQVPAQADQNTGAAAVFTTSVAAFLADETLGEEVFGPATLILKAANQAEIEQVVLHLEGQLTASLHGTDAELAAHAALLAAMERKAGRIICNGFPTGVEVCHAMVHGGPYPATADGRSTSVGVQAVSRFTRPISFQNFPDTALPPELQEANPLGISRIVDGVRK
jgi:2,5-dioxopentanoate dehydrogenase